MMRTRYGKQSLRFNEYYTHRVYDPIHSSTQKRAFVGLRGNLKLNKRLSPHDLTSSMREFLTKKPFTEALISKLGFPTTETQAILSCNASYGSIPSLRTAAEIETFLSEKARYPIFVKPEAGSGSVGSALVEQFDRSTGELQLLNGSKITVRKFSEEIFEDYAAGFLIQSAIQQHPALYNVTGSAVGTIRVVTVLRDEEPEILYTLWKIPSPTAMSDNYWQDGSMLAELDRKTGQIIQCRKGTGPCLEQPETHPESGKVFRQVEIPHWDEVRDMTTRCHALFPHFGVLGWDVAITESGPMIVECNVNPHHTLYQLATGRGILNDEFLPIFDAVAQRAETIIAKRKSDQKQRQKKLQ
ncbi:hypothetical protein M8744_05610 [Lutimaribacter sp. EGI FJ00013]|uniref:Uncharacterized protein n=1 Tax=Lutimaribacter degradans TaxID=2945989 RepID=A0ACC5ZU93_9RHOB|nr:sugar-transfer associated ATP-grasp domain-containing protein [Lutimaribacter sp. EGI FJ00013]MCM2561616.1 hypothetical protein [Lutimaribacter sp. EGI FJ00013]